MSENAVKILRLKKQLILAKYELMVETDKDRRTELVGIITTLGKNIKELESENCKKVHKQIRQMLGK